MPQKYKIATMCGNADKESKCRVYIRVMTKGDDIRIPTVVRVKKESYSKGKIIKDPNALSHNQTIKNKIFELERIISEIHAKGGDFNKNSFTEKNNNDFESFVKKHIELHKGKFSEGRIRHLESNLNMLIEFDPDINFNKINIEYLQKYEKWLRSKRKSSTVLSKMSTFISFLNAAADKELFDKKKIVGYKRPKTITEIPCYLTESEIEAFKKVVESIGHEKKKNAGYYFLLSCYAGYRISDCSTFDYNERVKDNILTLRAKKNGEIVSIPIYPKLAEILKYCKENKFINFEQDAREFVKEIAKDAGLKNWKDIKFHSGRHSFAMFLLSKRFSIDKVAEFLGDSKDVVRVYARIINPELHKEVREKLF